MKDQDKIDILTKGLYNILLQEDVKCKNIANEALNKIQVKKVLSNKYEINKIYITKLQTGWEFLLKEIVYKNNKSNIDHFKGIWIGREHLGICPLGADRLINE